MALVFFVYGLAFFSMGFAIALESRQAAGLRLASSLPYLAAFGILHSLVEWADMFLLIQSAAPSWLSMEAVRTARTLLIGISTAALVQFGASLLARRAEDPEPGAENVRDPLSPRHSVPGPMTRTLDFLSGRWVAHLPHVLTAAWGVTALLLLIDFPLGSRQWLIHVDIWARYLLYLPGALLSGFGLVAQARTLDMLDLRPIARDARFAAATFLLNALVAGLVVPPGQRFPALPVNYELFLAIFGIPVQVVRAASALATAYFVLRVLRVFRIQMMRQMELANRRQIQAQQEALAVERRAQAEMERWNRELEDRIRQRTAEIAQRNKQLLAVNSIAASLSQSFDLKEVLGQTLRKTIEALDAEGGGIFLSCGPNGEPPTQLSEGLPEELVRAFSRTPLDAIVMGRVAGCVDAESMPASQSSDDSSRQALSPGSFLTAPLKAKGAAIGVICLFRAREQGFGAEDGRLLTAIGNQVGVAVENARLFGQVQNMAALEERERIAREMHDGLAQVLGFLGIKARVLRQLVAAARLPEAERELEQMERTVQEAYADVRQSILSLRTSRELEKGLVAALRENAFHFTEQNSIPVELVLQEDETRFPPEAEVQLVRIAQEALANVRKHSRASKVWIRLERHDGDAILTIEDDGIGFDLDQVACKKTRCFGLETMRERAESVGAGLDIMAVPGEGTRIQVRFPVERGTTEPKRAP